MNIKNNDVTRTRGNCIQARQKQQFVGNLEMSQSPQEPRYAAGPRPQSAFPCREVICPSYVHTAYAVDVEPSASKELQIRRRQMMAVAFNRFSSRAPTMRA